MDEAEKLKIRFKQKLLTQSYNNLIDAIKQYMELSGHGNPNITGIKNFNVRVSQELLEFSDMNISIDACVLAGGDEKVTL